MAKRPTRYVLFVDLGPTPWSEQYRFRSTAEDMLKKIIETTPYPQTHAKLRLEECVGRKSNTILEAWENRDGKWVQACGQQRLPCVTGEVNGKD